MKWLILLLSFPALAASTPENLMTRLKSARAAYEKSNYDGVIQLLNPYSAELPNPGLMILANSYSKRGLYVDEVRVLRILAANNEKNYEAQMLLGQGLEKEALKTKDPDAAKRIQIEAVQVLRTVFHMRPQFKQGFDSLFSLLVRMKADSDARDILQEGLDRYGHRPELMKEMCRLDSTGGFVSQALMSCREAIKLSPNVPDNYVYLSQSFFDQKENNSAEKELMNAARRFPASEFIQWSTGTVFLKKKNYPVSARYYGQAVQADPTSSRAAYGYAQALFESGQEKQALQVFKKACKMDPEKVVEPFLAAASRLRQKGDVMATAYQEAASDCH
jgi:tetratricopeptide (TPR) repeat protein